MQSQPILPTERIRLVPLSAGHLEHLAGLSADPEVMRYLGGVLTREQAAEELRTTLEYAAGGLGCWTGFVDGGFAGFWSLRPGEFPGQAELGYRLLRAHWRQGLAKEGARELLRHGFQDVGLGRIFARTAAANKGSQATMASLGLRHVRDFVADPEYFAPGDDLHAVEYAVGREEWLARG
ncbi:GNAT family N-acetyltransferase [Amycolatopsis echigonensis]|uniref:GNAT family N-acetyltransferase n=1 Tax=Amycolatopsis echigonensis TaxID=2576905 RepID=A0A2N3WPM5_9PSEU|nr:MULTISPECIES: GNAT family N-acetyltransferase [Amycolatopsis]MBB2504361.1 GNAT family N-acetyltransferase [Amycolatopsis echigonensis]PKV95810.1 RimJ/RimL family protein N-acetyltransferase [Amycolatopsis niigatensis]